MTTRQVRAPAMSPDDRRRAIVEAVIPLLAEHGSTVTTRQMAEAAGVAEGTIFNVFPDKCALMYEAVKVTMDPSPGQTRTGGHRSRKRRSTNNCERDRRSC